MSEKMRLADFHQDRVNPWLAEILDNPEFQYAAERQRQLPKAGLEKLDIIFASLYRRANDAIKEAAKTGNEEVLGAERDEIHRILDYYHASSDFRIIERPEDLQLADGAYEKNNAVLHLESGEIITSPDVVDELYERGLRSVGPLYSHDNQLGGGSSGNKERGLTALGKQVVDRMIEKGMIIDIAHSNRRTAHDILERVRNYPKAVATHTALGSAQRFITPQLMKEIASRGGVVGFTLVKPWFKNFENYIQIFKKASDALGSTDNLAVASDFGGLESQYLFEEVDEIGKLSRVAEELSTHAGLSDEDIAKIMYGNVARIVGRL